MITAPALVTDGGYFDTTIRQQTPLTVFPMGGRPGQGTCLSCRQA